MATQLQIRRGTASQIAAFTGAEGEVSANTTNESLHVHNGSTAGGFETARADLNNVTDASLNAALTGNTVSALTITTLTLGSTAITATGAEINILDGVTSTTAELNYVDGVTSAIQTQLDAKAPLASPTFTGTVTVPGLTTTADVSFGDNDKAIFGSGSDLQIYHDGSNSYLEDTGTGALFFKTNGAGAYIYAGSEALATFNLNGANNFYYDNALKLSTTATGIDVTGTVTADGLTVQTTNGLNALFESTTSYQYLQFKNSSATTNYIGFVDDDFVVNPPTGLKMIVTAEGRAGIGVTSPQRVLTLSKSDSTGVQTQYTNSTTGVGLGDGFTVGIDSSENAELWNYSTTPMLFATNGTERARITGSDGHFLVGNTVTNPASGFNNQKGFAYAATTGQVQIATNANSSVLELGKNNANDGSILVFRKQSTTLGSIGTTSGSMYIEGNPATGKSGLTFFGSYIEPRDNGAAADGAIDLGSSSNRFKDLYLSGGVVFPDASGLSGSTSSSNKLDSYEEGTCTIGFSTNDNNSSTSRLDNTTGYYQKTGNICTVQFYSGVVTFSAAGTGYPKVTGLPFNNRAGTYNYGAAVITHNTATATDVQNGYTVPNANFFIPIQRHTTSSAAWVTGGIRYFMFSVTYLTT